MSLLAATVPISGRDGVPRGSCFVGRLHAAHVRPVGFWNNLNRVVLSWEGAILLCCLVLSEKLSIFVQQLIGDIFHCLDTACPVVKVRDLLLWTSSQP